MKTRLSTLAIELQMLRKGGVVAPPTEFCVFQPGVLQTTKGLFNFTEKSATSCMDAAADYGNEYPVDYNHAMFAFITADPAQAGKAAGWFRPEVREGALWAADVSWTPLAKQMLQDREYRYFSPTFRHTEDGEVLELLNVALTNMPASKHQEPLMASRAGEQQPTAKEPTLELATFLALLGLAATSSPADITAAITSLKNQGSDLASLLTALGARTTAEASGAIAALKMEAAKLATLSARLAELEKAQTEGKLLSLLDQAKRDGKVTPAMEPMLLEMGRKDVAMLESFLKVASPIVATSSPKPPKGGEVAGLSAQPTAEELHISKLTGVDVKDIVARRIANDGDVPSAPMKDTDADE